MTGRNPHTWMRGAAITFLLVVLVTGALRELLTASSDRLPGTDAGIHYGWEIYTRSVLRSGRLPYWNPYQYAGMPHLADSQMMVLYPPAMLLRWLPSDRFLTWLAALHLVIGGAGALFLGRVLGLGWLASAAAAIAVALGGSVGPWLHFGHLLIVNCVAWLSWALGAAVLTVRRGSLLPHPLLPSVMVLQLLAGYPQGTLYITAVVASYFLYSAVWPESGFRSGRRWRPLAQLAVVGAMTAGLSAFQFFPLLRLAAEAARTAGLPYEDAARGGWGLGDLTSFFVPDPLASDRTAYIGWLLACVAPLAFFDRSHRRMVVFLAGVTVVAVALAFGDNLPLYRLHHFLFPGFRIPGRALFVATLSLATLGAIGLAWLVAAAAGRAGRRAAVLALSVVVGAALVWTFAVSPVSGPRSPAPLWPAALAGLVAVVWLARVDSRLAFVPALAVVAVELTTVTATAVQSVPADRIATVRSWLGPPDAGRVITLCEQGIGRGVFSLAERPSIAGPLGMNLKDYVDWLGLVDSGDRPSDMLGRVPVRHDLLDVSNVSTVVACEPIDAPSLTLVSTVDGLNVYRNESAWPRAVWTCAAQMMSRSDVAARLRRARYATAGRLVDTPVVSVRWAADLDETSRAALESRYGLTDGVHRDGSTWRYVLRDVSAANVRALIRDVQAEDTHGVDRQTGDLTAVEDVGGSAVTDGWETLVGTVPCDDRGRVDVLLSDQPDGRVEADVEAPVDGYVFLSEPYYPERLAFVDGNRVDVIKANLAFMAVPVPAGRHRVEVRLVPATFYSGLSVSTVTLLLWFAAAFVPWQRRPASR